MLYIILFWSTAITEILKSTPLYTSILTEELNRIYLERDFWKSQAQMLKMELEAINGQEAPIYGKESSRFLPRT